MSWLVPSAEATAAILANTTLILAIYRHMTAARHPGDAVVTAVLTAPGYPDEGTVRVTVVIANPSDLPVLVGLSPRRPGWPGRGLRTWVPSRTTRRRYRADRQATVGIVPPGMLSQMSLFVPARRLCRLAIVIGQPDGRLRVISVPVIVRRLTARQRSRQGGSGTTTRWSPSPRC